MTATLSHFAPLPYPEPIASWWLDRLCDAFDNPDPGACLEALVPWVQRLSDRFITFDDDGSRALEQYGQDQKMLLAYGAFFFPQTFARVQFPLAELCGWRGWWPELSAGAPMRILDWGAGLGAASLGALHWLREFAPALSLASVSGFDLDIVEIAPASLEYYRALTEELAWEHCEWRWHAADMRRPHALGVLQDNTWELIMASFSLNEAFESTKAAMTEEELFDGYVDWLRWQLAHLAPGGLLLVLEPASQVATSRLMQARDRLIANGEAFVWGPCWHQKGCPMDGVDAWCHEVRHWTVPDHLQWLNRQMYRSLSHLKFSFLALGKDAPASREAGLPLRLVSPMTQKKGRWLTTGCTAGGALWPLEVQRRDVNAATKALFKRASRGDLMSIGHVEETELSPHPHTGLIRLPKDASMAPLPPLLSTSEEPDIS